MVNQRPDAATLAALGQLQFPMQTSGAEVSKAAGGHLEIRDGADVVGTANAPVMWDARTNKASGDPAVTQPIGMDLAPASQPGTDATVVLSPPQSFLTDPATVYPVTIDPTQTLGLLGDTFVQNNIVNTPQGGERELRVGSYNSGGQIDRSLLLFDVEPALYSVVQSAQLSLFENYSYSCSPRWMDVRDADWFDPRTVTWGTQPWIDWSTGGIKANANVAFGGSGCAANWVNFNLTGWLAQYANVGNGMGDQMALAVTAGSETDSYAWKKFNSADAGSNIPTLTFTRDGFCDQVNNVQVCGAIRNEYWAVGGDESYLGRPITGEQNDGNGTYWNQFERGWIYWNQATGAHFVQGSISDKWTQLGRSTSYLGLPVDDEYCVQLYSDRGCWSQFQRGSIYWTPWWGAHNVQGAINDKWVAMGHEWSYLGWPQSDEICIGQDPTRGCHNDFERGSIYWTQTTGAHNIDGPIRNAWLAAGGETGWLGYPASDPLPIAGGWRQEFQGGNLVYDNQTGNVRVGAGVLKNPTQFQRVTQARTQLNATAKVRPGGVSYDRVKFQWRNYDLTLDGGWADVNAAQDLQTSTGGSVTPLAGTTAWLPVKSDNAGGLASQDTYTWNATSSIPDDGLKQVRACLRVTGKADTDPDGMRCTGVTQITVDRAGLTGANATADAGPGTVGLLTGAYSVTGRDADLTAPHGGLAATRSFASNAPNRAGPLGPGWALSLAVDEASADYQSLTDRTDSVLITRADGTQMPFLRKSATDNNYLAEGEASTEGWTLTFNPGSGTTAASYLLTDIDGDKVTFVRGDGATGHPATDGTDTAAVKARTYRVDKIEAIRGKTAAGTKQDPAVTSVRYTAAGNPRWLLAPTDADAGVVCADPSTAAQPAGCRALEFLYSGTGADERLTSIKLWATGAAATGTGLVTGDTPVAAQQITVATYSYAGGRLAGVTDPRTGQTVAYTYRADGRLATITPIGGTATWTLGYDAGQNGAGVLPRLATATLSDATSSALPAQTTSVRYQLDRTGQTVGLPSFTSSEVGRWGQTVTPTDLTAVFDPATVPAATPTDSQWRGATLYALDVNGRTVNTANYGGTINQDTGVDQSAAWRISTTEYDPDGRGNVIRSLTAGNRDRALAASTDPAAQATQAKLLDTVNVYSADGKDLLRSYAPARLVANAAGKLVSARTRTTTTYDTAAMHPNVPGDLHLPVTTTTDAVEIYKDLPAGTTGTEDPATRSDLGSLDGKSRLTTLEYGNDNAWTLGTATATRVRIGGSEVVTRQAFDDQGRTTSSTLPAGGTATNTAATTLTSYYAAASTDPECKSDAWAGWVCKTAPGGNPSAGFAVPTTWVSAYDVYGHATRTVETGQGITRTTDTAYDPAGRVVRTQTTGTGTEIGTARAITETTYTPAGLVDTTRLINPDGTPTGSTAQGTGPISRGYDAYGRLTSYTDGSGLTTSQTYDTVGRAQTTSNNQGTRTVSYDENGERGSLATSIAVSDVGTFTARYGADGTLVRETMPGSITALTKTDAGGDPVALTYTKTNSDGTTSQWLKSSAAVNGFDQIDSYRLETVTGAAGAIDRTTRYGYDDLGRLTTATDGTTVDGNGVPTGSTCTRTYGFDVNSNRTSLTQAGAAGSCPTSVANDSYAYDTADRLQPAGARATLRYDALGRTRTLPAIDTADGSADVAIDYYVDDLVRQLTQGTKTTTFGLDAAARRTVRTDSGAPNPTVSYYTGDDDNPDLVKETDNSYTRNITGFGGLEAIVTRAGTSGAKTVVQLANLHGDIAANVPLTATSATEMTVSETTEYGENRTQPTAGSTPARYGWLGSKQRDASTPGGLTLMGVRLYSANLGRFLSVDPVAGGSFNDYEYGYADPVNQSDIDGRAPRWVKKVAKVGARAVSKGKAAAKAVGRTTTKIRKAGVRASNATLRWAGSHKRLLANAAVGIGCIVATAGACAVASVVLAGATLGADLAQGRSVGASLRDAAIGAVLAGAGYGFARGAAGALNSLTRGQRYATNGMLGMPSTAFGVGPFVPKRRN
ncbi:RHS repeat-associated core domain-containing protein [Modestobacter sp. NPDC049651]|uniref:RHS repeat-associated core domain-containing protein n=1 Tax=unclassified Modestobacter TaxID=2643866 RepID=UPI00340745F4